MSAAAAIVKTWVVGKFTCTLSVQRPKPGALMSAVIEWAPEQPKRLTSDEIRHYRAGRSKALAEVSAELGVNAAVLELP